MSEQGVNANKAGQKQEDIFENLCRENGFKLAKMKEYVKSMNQNLLEPRDNFILVRKAPYISVYGKGKLDFKKYEKNMEWIVRNVKSESKMCRSEFLLEVYGKRIRVEIKNQDYHGSADEKLFYFFRHIEKGNFEEDEFVLVLTGDWWTQEHLDEMYEMSKETKEKTGKKVHIVYQYKGMKDFVRGLVNE